MSWGPFHVGEQPSVPLLITVLDADGQPLDLEVYDDVTVEGLPDGVTTIADAPNGQVQYTFTAPFTEPGTLSFVVKMHQDDGDLDESRTGEVEIIGTLTARATPAQAYAYTAQQASAADLQLAQAQVAMTVDRDLADDDVWDAIGTRDQSLIRQAISWQAVELDRTTALGLTAMPGVVTSMSTAGQSVAFAAGTTVASMTNLSGVVVGLLDRLSWKVRQYSAELACAARGPAPDPWHPIGQYQLGSNGGLYLGSY